MECELCYEEFNNEFRVPRVLKECGHTFCDMCTLKLLKNQRITCPLCRKVTVV